MAHGGEAAVRVVAGCLFEVSLPQRPMAPWRFQSPGPEVTLLAEAVTGDGHLFRFRAEGPGAEAGAVELRFRSGDVERSVMVAIAPEADLV